MTRVKSYYQLFLLLILIISFTSCFDIHEKITIYNDQSGTYRIAIENSGIMGTLAMLSGGSQYGEMLSKLDSLALFLSQREGITKVNSNFSPRNGDLFLAVDFENSKDFNKSLYAYFGYEKWHWAKQYIKVKKRKFQRMNLSPWIAKYIENNNITIPYQEYLGDIMLRTEVVFPGEVTSTKGENLQVNGTVLNQNLSLISLLHNKKSTKLKIKYKRKR